MVNDLIINLIAGGLVDHEEDSDIIIKLRVTHTHTHTHTHIYIYSCHLANDLGLLNIGK
jgi:glycerol-3-phosphate responsive antiterminator